VREHVKAAHGIIPISHFEVKKLMMLSVFDQFMIYTNVPLCTFADRYVGCIHLIIVPYYIDLFYFTPSRVTGKTMLFDKIVNEVIVEYTRHQQTHFDDMKEW
jgi:hypothetical protein